MSAFGDIVKEVKYIDDDLYVSFDEENYRRLELKLTIQENEIERLNNIINELEKYLNEQTQKSWEIEEQCYEDIESKLQELKGSDK